MNDRYVACSTCSIYVDAGYRWAYTMLEKPGVLMLGQPMSVQAVLDVAAYWTPPEGPDTQWLYERIFPALRSVLIAHAQHELRYDTTDHILDYAEDDDAIFDWMEVGHHPALTPRYCAEILNFSSWEQVEHSIEIDQRQRGFFPPWWWNETHAAYGERARSAFERFVQKRSEMATVEH